MTDPIYLDHNATTPVAPEALEAMLPWLRGEYGNPSSSHPYGQRAARAMAAAKGQVADLIGAKTQELVFTGCATEANNLALRWRWHGCDGSRAEAPEGYESAPSAFS